MSEPFRPDHPRSVISIRRGVSTLAMLVLGIVPGLCQAAEASHTRRTLTVEQRVAARRAIEQVYWDHRIWPKENPGTKPPLSAVMSDSAIRAKVEDDLRKSALLDSFWHQALTGDQLQAEINRMALQTKAPETLRDLFAALHDDPFLIAECLARPSLVERRVESAFAADDRIHGVQRAELVTKLAGVTDLSGFEHLDGDHADLTFVLDDGVRGKTANAHAPGREIHLSRGDWSREIALLAASLDSALENSPGAKRSDGGSSAPIDPTSSLPVGRVSRLLDRDGRFVALTVRAKSTASVTIASVSWTKRSYAEWSQATSWTPALDSRVVPPPIRGYSVRAPLNAGCANDTWSSMQPAAARALHTAVWTGVELIVWGGDDGVSYLNTGGRYNPSTDTWVASSLTAGSGANVPSAREFHTAIWTGTEMIVWGGLDSLGFFNSGGRYSPSADSWAASSLATGSGANVPSVRFKHSAVWTGSEMVIWGGRNTVALQTGGRYNPSTDVWAASSLNSGSGANVPSARYGHSVVWIGTEMIVWGGGDGVTHLSTGGRYNPFTDSWATSSLTSGSGAGVPFARDFHTAVSTGTEMIIWGGNDGVPVNTGGRYNPSTDTWAASSLTNGTGANVPSARELHAAVWTGSEMIVWGGFDSVSYLNTGGRYNPYTDTWAASSLGTGLGLNVPGARYFHTALWTGSAMIVWGGNSGATLNSGGRYCACLDGLTAYPDSDGDGYGNPLAPTTICGGAIPTGYVADDTDCDDTNAAIHPGTTEVCNGIDDNCNGQIDEGTLTTFFRDADGDGYGDPTVTSLACAVPAGYVANNTDCNDANSAIHPGATEVCNGIDDNCNGQNDEGVSTSTGWGATALTGAPTARDGQVGVSTGSLAIVWGGANGATLANTGSRYDPSADTWTTTTTTGAPTARRDATAVWTGTQMVVWGGQDFNGASNQGAVYQPSNDHWGSMSNGGLGGGSSKRSLHTAVWTGTKMIVWGGKGGSGGGSDLNSGYIWDQAGDTWNNITSGSLSARFNHTAVWSGSKMIVWGGETSAGAVFGDGASYDPNANSWSAMSGSGAPTARTRHTAIWTGSKMIVWGGWNNATTVFADGAIYDPASNSWTALPSLGAPSARQSHSAVWDPTDGLMIVWGGKGVGGTVLNDGAAYSPSTNAWTPLSNTNAPAARSGQFSLWVSGLPGLVVWGGDGSASTLNTGGRYIVTAASCGLGPCARQSTFGCTTEPLTYRCTPGIAKPEVCNGIDDDCNGTVDDGFVSQPTSCGIGACARSGATSCVSGIVHDSCSPGPPAAEVCNGIDDNCNGIVDDGGAMALCNDGNPCTDDLCSGAAGCAHANNTGPCSDGNACTQSDTCQSGACVGSNPIVCIAGDACHLAGTCAPETGLCTHPNANDGTSCSDGNACTVGDTCTGGVCASGSPITVPAEIQNLRIAADKATVSWTAPTYATQYDAVRGSITALPVGPGGGDEVCFNNFTGPSLVDAAVPSPGTGFWYVARGQDVCGIGTYGARSNGSPRVTTTCQCVDGLRDGNETDVDCGGGLCATCATGNACIVGSDCQSAVCSGGHCAAPTCSDGVKNGNETGVDCGWASCGACPDTQGCLANSDCRSGVCQGGACEPASCTPGLADPGGARLPDAECGRSGNTYWSYNAATPSTSMAIDDIHSAIYLSSGTKLSRLDPPTGSSLDRDFLTLTLGKPVVFRLKGGATNGVVLAASDGYVYGLDAGNLSTYWSRSLKRGTCSSDTITATPVVQRWDASDANFQATRTQDLVIVGTAAGCSSTTANKVVALDANDGSVVWSFNATGTSYSMDRVNGLTVDYGRNTVYVVSYKTDPSGSKNTVWAINTTNGFRRWAVDVGAIIAEPVLANGGLYVGTLAGVLYKLDPLTGSTLWQRTVTSGGAQISRLTADASLGRVYVLDTGGNLNSIGDACSTSSLAWATNLSGSIVTTAPAILGNLLYVGAASGRVYQLGAADGLSQSYATIFGAATASFDPLTYSLGGTSFRLLASAGGNVKYLCVPWAADHSDKALLSVPAGFGLDAPVLASAVAVKRRLIRPGPDEPRKR